MKKELDKSIYDICIANGYSKLSSFIYGQSGVSISDMEDHVKIRDGKYILPDISKLTDAVKAAEVIYDVIKNTTSKIIVNSDYDADGVTGGGIIDLFLIKYFNVPEDRIIILQNERVNGNGFNKRSLREVIDMVDSGLDIALMVTSDHGSKDDDRYKMLPNNIRVVVTDHHTTSSIPMVRPEAFVNPHRSDSLYDDRISGATVSYLVMLELAKLLKVEDSFILGLSHVGITTLSDQMDMRSPINRYLLTKTLKHMTEDVGGKWDTFGKIVNMPRKVTTKTIGFVVSPMLNGAGRMGKAITSRLFVRSDSVEEIKTLTEEMQQLNVKRREVQGSLTTTALNQAKQFIKTYKNTIVIRLEEGGGVAGIIGGNIGQMYNRPTFVFTPTENAITGSGRAIIDVSLPDAFEYIRSRDSSIIIYGGGHKAAAGVTIHQDKLSEFCREFDAYVGMQEVKAGDLVNVEYNASMRIVDIQQSIVDEVNAVGPFGRGLTTPVFKDVCIIKSLRMVGPLKNHAIIKVEGSDKSMFYPNCNIGDIKNKDTVNIYYTIEQNGKDIELLVTSMIK